MKKDNFDFISSKFEEENIKAPDSLSEERLRERLEQGTSADKIVKFKPNNKRFFKGAISIAAAIALIVVSVSAVNHFSGRIAQNEENPPKTTVSTDSDTDVESDKLIYFSSREEIDALMKERLEERPEGITRFFMNDYAKSSDIAAESGFTYNYGQSDSKSGASYSETYKQLEGVDEADIVKTDGKYIYYLSDAEKELVICSAKDGKTKKISKIKIKGDVHPCEFFVKDNSLVLISSDVRLINKKDDNWKTLTNITTYDIKNRDNPREKYSYTQSGYYDSSRMIGNCVYLVSNESQYYYIKDYVFPCVANDKGELEEIPAGDICAVKDSKSGDYTVIGALDITNGENKKTKAVIGSTDQIYCSENNLYLTGVNYEYGYYNYNSECTVVRISLDKTNIKIAATGTVKGDVNSQYSMDEKDGYFRIATTRQTQKGNDINVLYILNDKLEEVGRVNGFAKNEHIEAVRFIGDTAYVITYERTDPLFIIDLSDAENPEILGEVKISGFSTMLHPIDEKTLLGIGYSTDETEFGEATNGLKLALFDISNPAAPKVIGEKEFEGVDSDVQYNPRALVVNKEKNYFALPASFNDYGDAGALVFTAQNGKIKVLKKFVSDRLVESDRCLYIDNFVYVIDTYEEIIDSFEIETEGFTEQQLIEKATNILETKTNHKASEFSYVSTDFDSNKKAYVVDFAVDKDTLGGDIAIFLDENDLSLVDIVYGE